MSYAGVESESEYVQRKYDLVPRKGKCDHEAIKRLARQQAALRLTKKASELGEDNSINWKKAFRELEKEIAKEYYE